MYACITFATHKMPHRWRLRQCSHSLLLPKNIFRNYFFFRQQNEQLQFGIVLDGAHKAKTHIRYILLVAVAKGDVGHTENTPAHCCVWLFYLYCSTMRIGYGCGNATAWARVNSLLRRHKLQKYYYPWRSVFIYVYLTST